MPCEDCGNSDANTRPSNVLLCGRCYDNRNADYTGFPRLPDPPPSVLLHRPDGRDHRFRFTSWRAPTGIEVRLEEMEVPVGEGYRFAVLGDHDADVGDLVARVRSIADSEIGRLFLEPARYRDGWTLRGDEVAGQLVWNDEGGHGEPYRVIIDGRVLSWGEFGRALESYEGWRFRLVIEDSIDDARSDADVIELPGRGSRPEPSG